MKKVKGAAAFTAALLAVNSATLVFAAGSQGGGATGIGRFEGNVSSNVFDVEVPLLPEDDSGYSSAISFIIDPNDLIRRTSAAKYEDAGETFAASAKGVYFKNENSYDTYSGRSDNITAINKGTNDVHVSVKAELLDYTGITIQDTKPADWTSIDTAGLYMAITKDETTPDPQTIKEVDSAATATLKDDLSGLDTSGFDLTYTAEAGYQYVIPDTATYESYLKTNNTLR